MGLKEQSHWGEGQVKQIGFWGMTPVCRQNGDHLGEQHIQERKGPALRDNFVAKFVGKGHIWEQSFRKASQSIRIHEGNNHGRFREDRECTSWVCEYFPTGRLKGETKDYYFLINC